jgi:hypothetical protein
MWHEGKLARLHEELELLDVFDRVHDYAAHDLNRADNDAYVSRQQRRSEISAEIAKLRERRSSFKGLGTGSLALLVTATLYATLHYLLK